VSTSISVSDTLIYLASPYTHPDSRIRHARFVLACAVAGDLMLQGHRVFSPVAHSHSVAMHSGVPANWEFWEMQDTPLLLVSDTLVVLQLPAWETSVGVTDEIKTANAAGIAVEYLVPNVALFQDSWRTMSTWDLATRWREYA
jgi:hypothetical protein